MVSHCSLNRMSKIKGETVTFHVLEANWVEKGDSELEDLLFEVLLMKKDSYVVKFLIKLVFIGQMLVFERQTRDNLL